MQRTPQVGVLSFSFKPFSSTLFLIVAKMSLPERSNPPFVIFDIRALWRSGLNARVPEYQKIKTVG